MTLLSFTQNGVSVKVSDKTLTINSDAGLQLSFSPSNELTLSVSDQVASQVCGACGTDLQTGETILAPGSKLWVFLQGQATTLAKLNTGKWEAPDFPEW